MSEPEESPRLLVENWLTDVQRRGAELYATNEGDEIRYFSFEGRDRFRFSIEIDFAVQDITLQITDPKKAGIEIERLALTSKNLEALARMMCSVKEGEAVVPVYLLAQLAVICHGYQRLIQELDQVCTGSIRPPDKQSYQLPTTARQPLPDWSRWQKESSHKVGAFPETSSNLKPSVRSRSLRSLS